MSKVNIDQTRFCNQFGDALHSLAQDIISQPESHIHWQVARRNK